MNIIDTGSAELRWCLLSEGEIYAYCPPTAADALEYAEKMLQEGEELLCCTGDERIKNLHTIKKLINSTIQENAQ